MAEMRTHQWQCALCRSPFAPCPDAACRQDQDHVGGGLCYTCVDGARVWQDVLSCIATIPLAQRLAFLRHWRGNQNVRGKESMANDEQAGRRMSAQLTLQEYMNTKQRSVDILRLIEATIPWDDLSEEEETAFWSLIRDWRRHDG